MAVNDSIDRINIGGDERMIKPGAENVRVSNVPIGGEYWTPGNVQTALENLRNYVKDNATQIAELSGKTDLVFGSLNNGIFYDINGNEAVRSATLLYIDRSTGIIYRWGTNSFVVVSKEPMDSAPTSGSQKPITSGGVYNALTAGNIRVAEIKTGRGIPNPISSLDPSAPVSMIAEKWPVSDVQAGLDDLVKKVYGAIGQESSGSGSSATTSTTISAKETVTDGGEMNSQVTINPDGTIVRSATQQSDVTISLPSSSGTLALQSEVAGKQDALVSGQNIKTVNGTSVLGSGNLTTGIVVNLTATATQGEYTPDTTYADAASAVQSGRLVVVRAEVSPNVYVTLPLTETDFYGAGQALYGNSIVPYADSGMGLKGYAAFWLPNYASVYLSEMTYGEADPTVPSHVKGITQANIASWSGKQDALVSGRNIKSINGQSVLGAGNLELGELFVVTMTRNNSVYTADKSVSEIYAASYTDGKPVIAVMRDINNPVFILTDCDPDADSYVFSAIESNVVTTLRWQQTDDYTYELETMVLQPHLVSGTNIKTLNNESLLGGGNVNIVGKSAYQSYVDTTTDSPVKTEAEWIASLKGEDGVSLGEVAIADNLTTDDATKVLSARQGYELNGQINGFPAVTFVKSDYQVQPGLITDGVFRNNGGYGTKNAYVLIPFSKYRGRSLTLTAVAGHDRNTIAFLTTDALVSGEAAPYCNGITTISTSTTTTVTVPQDCNYLYVYAEREGADSFPSISIAATDSTFCSNERADEIEANLAAANQNIEAVDKHITLLNVNEVAPVSSGAYTLAEAIDAIPQSMRRGNCVLRYSTKIQSYYFRRIAFFLNNGVSGWSDTKNWIEIGIRDWSNVGESAGAFKMKYSGQTSVGANTSMRRVLVPFDKMVVYRHSSDNYGRWRILVRYADGTNEFVNITANEITTITPSKETLGFEFYLMSTSETCNIDADVLIGAAEKVFELTYKDDPTAESLGAVPINQGIGNAGRPLVVGADGKVAPGTATPSTVDGDAVRKVLTRELHLGADLASVTTMGTGWSGSVANGFTHASGNTDPLVLNPTTNGNAYLVTINCDTNAENLYLVSIGDGQLLDPYNGTTQQKVGIISDGGAVIITPSSSFAGTMTIKVQECVSEEDAVETVILNVYNVEAENMGAAITAFWNVAIGPGQSTLGKAVSASRNIAIGINSLTNLETGTRNIGIGTFALAQLKNGKGNIGIGADTYYRRQGGDDNVAIGRACMGGSTETVNNNVCIGRSAGEKASGDDNVCIGVTAGYGAAGGCVHIGKNAGYSHDAGLKNIFIGFNSGYSGSQRTGSWNTVVGPSTTSKNGVSKSTAVGYGASCTKSNQVVLGNYSATAGDGTVETKVHGDLVVRGTDGISRRIVFNSDNTVTWESVS